MDVKPILRVDPGSNWGRLVNFEELRREQMDIEPEIIAAGWRNFFQIRNEVYIQEVYEFWKNTKMVGDTIVSHVDNLSVIVTKEVLEKVTECPIDGVQLINKVKWMTKLRMNEGEVSRQLYGRNDPTERRASWLVPKARVLFAILSDCVLPRIGSRHQLSTLDEQCIFHLLNHHPIDLPFLIFQYMIKLLKEPNTCHYGMMLTRVFRDSGIRLDWGNRQKIAVRSYIDRRSIAKMGLKNSERKSPKKARIEGERTQKKSPVSKSRSRSQESKSGGVRFFESGDLKRKGESLLSDVPKKAKRSPRVKSVLQIEAMQSRESSYTKHSELQRHKITKSLASIIQKESEEVEKKRKMGAEKLKAQPVKTPRLRKIGAKKGGSQMSDMTTMVVSQHEVTSIVDAIVESPDMTDNPVFDIVVPTTFKSTLVSRQIATSVVGQEVKQTVLDVLTTAPSTFLRPRREGMEHRLVVREEPKTKSVIIRDKPKRFVKGYIKPVVFDYSIMHLLDSGYKNFYDQLKRVAKEPYPPEPSAERLTMYPILESTLIKVVPDLQPSNFVEVNSDKLKLKVHPEPVVEDLSADQITEAVSLIDAACEVQRNARLICVYQDPGTSKGKAEDVDAVGGRLRECPYNPLQIGVLECSYFVMENILRNRPLWDITSVAEVLPWFVQSIPRLLDPDHLDLPEPSLPISPPLLQVIELVEPTEDAYTTTVAIVDKPAAPAEKSAEEDNSTSVPIISAQSKDKVVQGRAAEPLTLEQKVDKMLKEMKKIKRLLKKLTKQSGQ